MGMGPMSVEIILTFFVAATVLYRYGNWYRHHIIVTVAVLIAWYFSMLIVFVLPIDVSNTIYETCLHDAREAALKRASLLTTSTTTTTAAAADGLSLTRIPRSVPRNTADNGEPAMDHIEPVLPDAVDKISNTNSALKNITGQSTTAQPQGFMLPPGHDDKTRLDAVKQIISPPLSKNSSKINIKPTVLSGNSKMNKDITTKSPGKDSVIKNVNSHHDRESPPASKVIPNEGAEMNTSSAPLNTTVVYHEAPVFDCREPWSRVKPGVFPAFWRVVYWTSQVLTWLILPLMQSYTKAGEFTVWGKLRSALIDNAIYYGSYLLIVGILLLYIALKPDVYLNGSQLRAIAASASNTWGLFWLVLLLGYGLVEVPRWLWNAACPQFMLNQGYFKSAKLAHERAEAWDHLNDLLQSLNSVGSSIGSNHPLRPHLDTIEARVPTELLDKMRRAPQHDSPHADVPSEKALVRLHKQLLKALQHHNRVETQWSLMVDKVIYLEDAQRNSCSHDTHFKHSTPQQRSNFLNMIYTPTIEWLWVCRVRGYLLRCVALMAALVSAAVVWSELTFFNKSPTLSIFAIIVNMAKSNYDYITIEIISSLSMAYIALCAYSTLFAVRVLNLYYLAPHHQTDQYSLIFSGMMLCRLTPPMCLNFLSLIHMDSHIIGERILETHYTQIMGHMDVISIISDGFNVYFPMMIVALCLATYYSLGSRLLSAMGFQQFIGSDGLTTDLIDEGRTLINRESRKRQRQQESAQRRREFTQRFGVGESTASLYRSARQRAEELLSRPYRRAGDSNMTSNEAAQMELLNTDSNSSPQHNPPTEYGNEYNTRYSNSGGMTQFSTPQSDQYNTQYNGRYSPSYNTTETYTNNEQPFTPPPAGGLGGRYTHNPDKGLFDDI